MSAILRDSHETPARAQCAAFWHGTIPCSRRGAALFGRPPANVAMGLREFGGSGQAAWKATCLTRPRRPRSATSRQAVGGVTAITAEVSPIIPL
jgi:hypothetical protein